MFTSSDKDLLKSKGISELQVEEQLNRFKTGFPFLRISAPATKERGVLCLTESEADRYLHVWDNYLQQDRKIVKFVPASGAASRMFKNLFEFLDAPYAVPTTDFEKKFFDSISRFAFYNDLNQVCLNKQGKDIPALIAEGAYKTIVSNLLQKEGLNYGSLPKGLLKFHSYPSGARTAMEEHLVEGALYAANRSGYVNIHFTVSEEHKELFRQLVAEKQSVYAKLQGVTFNVGFSEQKSSTDTIAADMNNEPFRDNGKLLFRPGGHGALIENLNDRGADIIFVKNIDNVVPDHFKDETIRYKKVLGGVLVTLQQQISAYINRLETGDYTMDYLREVISFLQQRLFIKNPDTKHLEDSDLVLYLLKKLRRPIRVCGMVRNEGEPGGGPFLAYNPDGTISLQILESSQINMNDPEAKAAFDSSAFFNPVDLVCGVKNHKREKFDLTKFVDPNTGFISFKSKNGKELKALELPGLWNGAMSDWNTVFVEVPAATFNPVKTVNDLLREQHQ